MAHGILSQCLAWVSIVRSILQCSSSPFEQFARFKRSKILQTSAGAGSRSRNALLNLFLLKCRISSVNAVAIGSIRHASIHLLIDPSKVIRLYKLYRAAVHIVGYLEEEESTRKIGGPCARTKALDSSHCTFSVNLLSYKQDLLLCRILRLKHRVQNPM